ncbi:fumarylacetoacetate hydrolase family protein [Pseudonocardia eucalypti]|uniref:Fumarylacetoacetate hydrolase family protein n=2 Tax=Pseudonocardia eucalypti TaxID=648755 RepID=A0ABP9QJQ5_9PSEU
MKLASFTAGGRERFGIVTATGLVDLSARLPVPDLKSAFGLGPGVLEAFAGAPCDWALEDVSWLPPIPNPTHVIGIGLNTKSHFAETAELMNRVPGDYPRYPRLFMRSPHSHVGHDQPVVVPDVSASLDYEGEIALVIGRPCHGVTALHAAEYILGYACYNDGSLRDFQMHSNQVTAGKNFLSSGAFGPWIVTADEVPEPSRLTLQTRVNGEVRQRLDMADLIFGFGELIAYISQIYGLQPGDTILTGSPAGIGALSQTWLRAGDRVEIEIPAVGTLSNPVVASGRDAA